LLIEVEKFPLKEPFQITGYTMTVTDVVTVTLETEGRSGWAEATGIYYRNNDDVPAIVKQIEAVRPAIEAGVDRESLQRLLPAGEPATLWTAHFGTLRRN
jgi:hypothetical protein